MNKVQKLENHLAKGKWANPIQAFEAFGISPSCYHSTLNYIRKRNNWPPYVKKKVKTKNSYYLKHKVQKNEH